MCAALCGPLKGPESNAARMLRIYVHRAPATPLEQLLLRTFDQLDPGEQDTLRTAATVLTEPRPALPLDGDARDALR